MRKRHWEGDGPSPRTGANRFFQRGVDQPLDDAAADTDAVPVSDHDSASLSVAALRRNDHASWQAMAVTFILVLIASLLMLEARRAYVCELVTSQARDGTVGVPPM